MRPPVARDCAAGKGPAMVAALVTSTLLITTNVPHDNNTTSERPPLVRVKPADAEMRRLVTSGYQRSPTFRALVLAIHQSNVLVVIQFGLCANGRIRSCVSHVAGDERQRHIRIKVDTRTTDDRLIATIAHELQHALEIAQRPEVTNSQQVLALYRTIGIGKCRQGLSELCETEAALQVETLVNTELDPD